MTLRFVRLPNWSLKQLNSEMNIGEPDTHRRASWYKRLFAYMMAQSSAEYNGIVGDRKRALLGGLRGSVLEIGAGTAPNLGYYSRDIDWLGIEPNPAMFPYARRQAQELGINIALREGQSERLPVPDASIDAVVSTLVLCSVRDQVISLQEVLRVLKPGGQFVFIEHVAAERGTGLRRLQGVVRPLWQLCSDGCQPNRETWTTIENAGFSHVQLEHFHVDAPIVSPHIAGTAVK